MTEALKEWEILGTRSQVRFNKPKPGAREPEIKVKEMHPTQTTGAW